MHFDDAATELLSITVDGAEHTYEASVDTDGDGASDAVHVDTDHGSYEYADTDGDGVADSLTQFDADGHITGHAVFDPATGGWENPAPNDTAPHGTAPSDATPPQGIDPAGAPTIDSNADGVADTALTHTADGTTVLLTDTDGDGSADTATAITTTGDVTTYDHSSDGVWLETSSGNLADSAPQHVAIDPATGAWSRR